MNTNTLDQVDLQILRLLQTDAKLTNKQLALKLHKASNTIYDRVDKLKKLGYITGTMTLINRKKMGEFLIAFTHVQLNEHTTDSLKAFQYEASKFSEVMECYHMTGSFDFNLKIVVRDMTSYNEFLVERLAKLSHVGSLRSYFVINEAKRELAYPIEMPSTF
ncbi:MULTISPECIES: Lrp/AsnC family transcriptional regulator [Pedobacter]|uniref:Regulatory protein AsnC/Lrp family n=1 Tax=Pedobacter heparinus (strain ATCC 13125 / DSM 2366 / CIP 104194 / JCM 7457 / NBRC 12017 / NCIMB 9290 / NRRL B-14731 / HIM 762-3) TaxID=485917 RepID=C6Y1M8_PEDHD|nr:MULTISPECIES: Lrp/AsnC family transcriptional regulator [Pedobacter]ACU05020.1 regulatory protein AsnC/Lrp family [Pedobacter heparinus DSM 2366]MBB5437749.1 DNA-binding Lrp family transcriptional regulator [Pedobacter sp. AK017]